ncbi:MAG: acyltransferase domain-containing protein, partial [Terriglobales bacterium]
IDLRKMLGRSTDAPKDQHAEKLNQTLFAHPALFTIEYALARLWQSLKITPAAMVGHSMGEYVAACLAGVLSLEDALHLIAIRARLVNDLPQGAMLAVLLPEKDLLPLLPGELSISLVNGPSLCVVAGPAAFVAEFEQRLQQTGIISRRVQNAHAFHSRMLTPIVSEFEREVRKVRLNKPAIPYISNVTGKWITAGEATNPSYWAMHADHTARFSDALQELWRLNNPVLLEAGPGRTLGVLAMQHPERQRAADPVTVSSLRHHYENQSDVEFLLQGIGRLWLSGIEIQWERMYPAEKLLPLLLPADPFESLTCGDTATGAGHVEVASELERQLTALCESVLDHKGIAIDDNFFDLGAHSLMIAKLLGKIEFDFGVRLSMDSIIEAPSVRQLAALMESRGVARTPAPRTAARTPDARTPLLWFDMHLAQHIAAHLGDHPDFVGIPLHTDETRALQGQFSMEKLASCMVNTIRGVQPEGPYCLGGWCNCGVLAYETAQQLVRQGSEVALVVMMDSVDYSHTSQWKIWASKLCFRASQFVRRGKGESANYAGHRIAPTGQGRRRPARARAMQFDTRLDKAGFVYEPKPYAGHVVALYPTRLPSYRDPYANWAGLVTGEFEAYEIKGTHTSMLGEAGATHLAARIESCIAEINFVRKQAAKAAARTEDTSPRTWIEESEISVEAHESHAEQAVSVAQ